MKKLWVLASALSLTAGTLVCSDEPRIVSSLTMTEEDFLDLLQDPTSLQIRVEEGTRFSLRLKVNSPVVDLEAENPLGTVVVKAPFYVKLDTFEGFSHEALEEACELSVDALKEFLMKNTQLLFSLDQITWKSFDTLLGGNLQANIFTEETTRQHVVDFLLDLHLKP
ncbi:MAG: hypothetical protein FJZ63_07005 [Chlamydiae bacterium]|nr:hypothetical protein [Chlamydiota bacterium]